MSEKIELVFSCADPPLRTKYGCTCTYAHFIVFNKPICIFALERKVWEEATTTRLRLAP